MLLSTHHKLHSIYLIYRVIFEKYQLKYSIFLPECRRPITLRISKSLRVVISLEDTRLITNSAILARMSVFYTAIKIFVFTFAGNFHKIIYEKVYYHGYFGSRRNYC